MSFTPYYPGTESSALLPHLFIVLFVDLTSLAHPPPPPPLCQKVSQAFNSMDLLSRVIITLNAIVYRGLLSGIQIVVFIKR